MKIKIKIIDKRAKMPEYARSGDVGMDVFALEDIIIPSRMVVNINLGFALEFPTGFVARMSDKSGLGKRGIHVFGGVYDAGYRGEYNVSLYNSTSDDFLSKLGEKLAQIIIYPVEIVKLEKVDNLSESIRGKGRFGSTGK
ncbi:MAG: dUTP pyrophosphatase [Candidatus Berkelbacteria bacterium Licking1014_7]|uniref:dUTP diphosphatase n=1 Tax=Candidatus Berkelbacteria bacterium Licking1014_7 TaxID=2017147 RepID=A0A554LKF1_9BACT|nr:MAG: dUTP pyrophosphatase [Candidatus Berkelbacteria bacterium Licking1014_7]